MPKMEVKCNWCGTSVWRYKSCMGEHVFCCSACRSAFLSKALNPNGYTRHEHLSEYNRRTNPNKMTEEVRKNLSDAHFKKGKKLAYPKRNHRHLHREMMEWMLGRKLKKGEVVHHIDEDKQNYDPENLMLFPSQSAHVRFHKLMAKRRGDAS